MKFTKFLLVLQFHHFFHHMWIQLNKMSLTWSKPCLKNRTSKRWTIVLFFLLSKYWVSFGDISFWWSTRFKFIGLFVGWCSFIKSSIGWCDLKNFTLALITIIVNLGLEQNRICALERYIIKSASNRGCFFIPVSVEAGYELKLCSRDNVHCIKRHRMATAVIDQALLTWKDGCPRWFASCNSAKHEEMVAHFRKFSFHAPKRWNRPISHSFLKI